MSWHSTNSYGSPMVKNRQSGGEFCALSHSRQQSTISRLQPVTRLHFMFVIVLTKKKLPFLVASLESPEPPQACGEYRRHMLSGCHLTPLLLIQTQSAHWESIGGMPPILARQMFLDHHSFAVAPTPPLLPDTIQHPQAENTDFLLY